MTVSSTANFLDLNLIPDFSEDFEIRAGGISRVVQVGNHATTSSLALTLPTRVARKDPFAAWWRSFLDDENSFGPVVEDMRDSCTYIDLFSSVGGLSLGFEQALKAIGIKPIPLMAVDVDDVALKIHRANHFTERTLTESVAALVDFKVIGRGTDAQFAYSPELANPIVNSLSQSVDAIVAGPPCQGHSTLNNHSRSDDPRNLLYLTVPALAVALNVSHVIIENVPNVVNDKMSVVTSTVTLLEKAGYKVTEGVLQAHQFGWPQTRKRFFLVASKVCTPISLDAISAQFRRPALPITWAINDISVQREQSDHLMNQLSETSSENIERINWLFDNDAFELPNHVRPVCHQDGHTYPSVYGRMRPDQPAPTLTTGFMSPGRGRFIHPSARRMLTPREAARLQGFPNWFDFVKGGQTKRSDLAKWIGDAVPSILGYFAGISLARSWMK